MKLLEGMLTVHTRSLVELTILTTCLHLCLGYKDTEVRWGPPGSFNPSLVIHNGTYLSTLRSTFVTAASKQQSRGTWINLSYLCEANSSTPMQGLACLLYHPWAGDAPGRECPWPARMRADDTVGIEDPKLWVWPGVGVFVIFGTKSRSHSDDQQGQHCKGRIMYHQYIAPVKTDAKSSPWALKQPLALIPTESIGHSKIEKNWMPFVWTDQSLQEHLLLSYSVAPHLVVESYPNGTVTPVFESRNDSLFQKFASYHVHGGPPVVHVKAKLSSWHRSYYLGIMHIVQHKQHPTALPRRQKLYRHFAFTFDAEPPFGIFAISNELPLTAQQSQAVIWTAGNVWSRLPEKPYTCFVSGLWLDHDKGTVFISYGSTDSQARILELNLHELEAMFTGDIAFHT